MSSPIHKVLFSPPPSPPTKSSDCVDIHTKHGIVSLKALLLPNDLLSAKGSLEGYQTSSGNELKARSPRTPQQKHFALEQSLYPAYPSRSGASAAAPTNAPRISVSDDIEATPRAPLADVVATMTPRRKSRSAPVRVSSPPIMHANVPSAPLPMPSSLPRPLIRLLFFAALVFTSASILVFVPAARLPSLRMASLSRSAALDLNGRGSTMAELSAMQDTMERDYVPPQVRVPHMLKRAFASELDATVPGPLKAIRPSMVPRPLPESHEILAIQSYLLDSAYNVLPSDIDPESPVDANKVSSHHMGKPGSAAEKAWFDELVKEKGQEVVVWYGGDGSAQLPHGLLDVLHALHGPQRHPTLFPCHSRADKNLLHAIFDRLSIPFKHHPLIMIGNTPIIGDIERVEELRGNGALTQMLKSIGWVQDAPEQVEATVVIEGVVIEDPEQILDH